MADLYFSKCCTLLLIEYITLISCFTNKKKSRNIVLEYYGFNLCKPYRFLIISPTVVNSHGPTKIK